MRRFALALALAAALATAADAGRSRIGTTGAAFLKIGVSPRAAALADAYGAAGDDVGAVLSNPAGLALLDRQQGMFVHARLVADLKLNSLFYALPLPEPWGRFGVNYVRLDYGEIERTTLNAVGAASPFNRAGFFSAMDHALGLSYADDFTLWNRFFRWGVTAKVIQQEIDQDRAGGISYDVGALYIPPGERWRYGIALQNIGFLTKFRDESDPLPLNLRLSGAGWLWPETVFGTLDVNVPYDNTVIVQTGIEVRPIRSLALRVGYRWDDNTSDYEGITAGLGARFGGVGIDYAYVPFERLDVNHRFSVDVKWGATRPVDLDMIDDRLWASRSGRAMEVAPVPPGAPPGTVSEAVVSPSAEGPQEPSLLERLWPFGRRRAREAPPPAAATAPAAPPQPTYAPPPPAPAAAVASSATPASWYVPPRALRPGETLDETAIRGREAWARGYAAGAAGRHAEAADLFYDAIAFLPDEVSLWENIAAATLASGRLEEARSIAEYMRRKGWRR